MSTSVKTKRDEAALKSASSKKNDSPDLNFLKKGIWEMTDAEMWARVEIEALTPEMAMMVLEIDNNNVSDKLLGDWIDNLQLRIRKILSGMTEIKGKLEDENGIAHSSHER